MRIRITLLLLLVSSVAHAQKPPSLFAITGAKIVPAPGEVIDNATVVIRDGVIAEAGAGVTAPAGARLIEGKGLVVYAGFIDCGAQFGVKAPDPAIDQDDPINRQEDVQIAMRAALRRGLRPELNVAPWMSIDDSWRKHRQVGFTTALLEPTGGFLNGQSALINLSGEARRASLVRTPVFMHATLQPTGGGFGGGGGGAGGYPGTLMGLLAHTRQFLWDAQWNLEAWRVYQKRPEARRPPRDEALEAVRPALDGTMSVVFRADLETDIRRALKFADEFHFKPIIAGGAEAWKLAPELARRKVPVIVSLNFGTEPKLGGTASTSPTPDDEFTAGARGPRGGPGGAAATGPAAPVNLGFEIPEPPLRWKQEQKRLYDEKVANAGKLRAAGVAITFTTAGLANVNDFHANLQRAIKAGLKSDDAVAALTTKAAALVAVPQLGSVRKGAIANLTVMTNDFDATGAKVKYVFIDGKFFEPEKETGPPPPATPGSASPPPGNDDERKEVRR